MKKLVAMFMMGGLLSGCVEMMQQPRQTGSTAGPTVIFQSTDSSTILACLKESENIRPKEFNRYYKAARKRAKDGDDEDRLRLICLSLHPRADYKVFRSGMEDLKQYIADHPENQKDLQGLLALIKRLDLATRNRWKLQKQISQEKEKLLAEQRAVAEEKETLLAEQEELRRQVEQLQGRLEQEQARIKELQSQIEQLKNIENIIKNREPVKGKISHE